MHVMKSLGRIAAECEGHDHGRDRKLYGEAFAKEVADLVICALHIAKLEGFDLQDAVIDNSSLRNKVDIQALAALAHEQKGEVEDTLPCELVVGSGRYHAGVTISIVQGAIDRMYGRLQQFEQNGAAPQAPVSVSLGGPVAENIEDEIVRAWAEGDNLATILQWELVCNALEALVRKYATVPAPSAPSHSIRAKIKPSPEPSAGSAVETERDQLLVDWRNATISLVKRAEAEEDRVRGMRAALERSKVALDDWLHVYAGDMCDPQKVAESVARISEAGATLAYIAKVQKQNRAALAQSVAAYPELPSLPSAGVWPNTSADWKERP